MLDHTKEVQGVAVYMEFSRGSATMQVIITPDGFDSDGNNTQALLYRRVVSNISPKKQWRTSSIGRPSVVSVENDGKQVFAEGRLSFAHHLFSGLVSGGWTLVGEPLRVEVSKKDMDSCRAHKTPAKVIYRINQSRVAAGYPAELFPTSTTV